MIILGIETSCDETALALIEASGPIEKPEIKILGEALHSQIDLHKLYGGVYPAMAKREHTKNLMPLFEKLLNDCGMLKQNSTLPQNDDLKNKIRAILEREPELLKLFLDKALNIEKPPIDAIAVTYGPGLEPALWVGINFAKALSELWNIPVLPTNHMEGHIASVLVGNIKSTVTFPSIALLVSGGHTELVLVDNFLKYKVVGETKDDAAGEAFDKVARILGLPYPGGPEISKLATIARTKRSDLPQISLPRPMLSSAGFDFSFSGLKTAVLYLAKKLGTLDETQKLAIALEFENAVSDVLVEKTKKAIQEFSAKSLIFAGGVSANTFIRNRLKQMAEDLSVEFFVPTPRLSTDNAIMISTASYLNSFAPTNKADNHIKAHGNLRLG
jgi:N6-L-threonylcarbamoyladenine synthase